jgi:hypothetical protein
MGFAADPTDTWQDSRVKEVQLPTINMKMDALRGNT